MTVSRRDMFTDIVADVKGDYPLVWEHAEGSMPVEGNPDVYIQYEVMNDLYLNTPTHAFANTSVRDAIILEACADEKFGFVLSNKVVHTVRDSDVNDHNVTQDDLEALATIIQVASLWGQVERSINLIQVVDKLVREYSLEEPRIIGICKGMILAQTVMGMDMDYIRAKALQELTISLDD